MIIERRTLDGKNPTTVIFAFPNEQYHIRGLCHKVTIQSFDRDEDWCKVEPKASISLLQVYSSDIAGARQYAADLLVVAAEAAALEIEMAARFKGLNDA